MRILFLSICCLFTLSIFAQGEVETIEWESKETADYTFQHPADWRYDESGLGGTTFFLYTNEKDPNNVFEYNINLIIQDIKGSGFDLKKNTEFSTEQIKQMGMEVLETEYLKNENGDFVKLVYAGNYSGHDFYWVQNYYVKEDNQAYVLTYTTHASDKTNIPASITQFFETFKFK